MDLIGAANLEVANDRDSQPTFQSANGVSWIDVTLVRGVNIVDWNVDERETLSDHRLIKFATEDAGRQRSEGPRRLITSRTDWATFKRELRRRTLRVDGTSLGVEEEADRLQRAAIAALKASTPTGKPGPAQGNRWWNVELGRTRRAVHRAREAAQRERDPLRRLELQEEFKRRRRIYKKRIKEEKTRRFREELQEATPDDPWGLAHRIMSRKRRATVWETVQDTDGN